MNSNATTGDDFIADLFRSHWLLFVLLGGLLIFAGGVAVVVPAVSSMAPSDVLGVVLVFAGIVQIAQSGKMQRGAAFTWHMTLGFLATIGGVLIAMDPFPGIVTITILMALVFAAHGLTQIVFAIKVRRIEGWGWFLGSGCIALVAAGLLFLKLPYGHTFTSATVGGVSLVVVGWAYVAVALTSRRS